MRLQCESCVYIVNLCREIVVNYSQTSLQLSHSSEIGALPDNILHDEVKRFEKYAFLSITSHANAKSQFKIYFGHENFISADQF